MFCYDIKIWKYRKITLNLLSNCYYLYAAWDIKSLNSKNKYIIFGNDLGLDRVRFEPGERNNITSPTNEFKMEL